MPIDTDSLLMQIKNLRAENKSLIIITQKDNLQNQVDNLTARIVQQEQAIETLNYHVNMMRGSKDQTSSKNQRKKVQRRKETKKSIEKLEIEYERFSNVQFSNATLSVQKPAKRTDKPWHNVCKSFNRGSCTRKNRKFEHKIVKTCYFYNQPDGCLKGKDCSFLHIKSMKNDTKIQVHQNTLHANAHDVKTRDDMQSAPNDNDNMAMKGSFFRGTWQKASEQLDKKPNKPATALSELPTNGLSTGSNSRAAKSNSMADSATTTTKSNVCPSLKNKSFKCPTSFPGPSLSSLGHRCRPWYRLPQKWSLGCHFVLHKLSSPDLLQTLLLSV